MSPNIRPALIGALTVVLLASPAQAGDSFYVTVGADAAADLVEAIGSGAELQAETNGSATVVKLSDAALTSATRFMHEAFHRCGGFVVHDSKAAATSALEAPIFRSQARSNTIAYALDNAQATNAVLAAIDPDTLSDTIKLLSQDFSNRYFRTPDGVRSALALQRVWKEASLGRDDVSVELFYHDQWPQPSVILTFIGSEAPDEVVVLGAHLDSTVGRAASPTTMAPGADDDASGVAALTTAAKAALTANYRPAKTVKFIAYAAEEVGLRGSAAIAASFVANSINVIGVMQLDMVLLEDPEFAISLIDDFTDPDLTAFLGELIDAYLDVPWTTTSCGYACSDHASWTEQGIPAAYPFESSSGANSQIHTSGDTLDASGTSVDHAVEFARLAGAFVTEMAKGDLSAPAAGGVLPPSKEIVERTSHTVSLEEEQLFGPFEVQPGSNLLVATYVDGSDVDLFVAFDSQPTSEEYDCRSARETGNETCFVRVPDGVKQANIRVFGFEEASYHLEVQYTPYDPNGEPEPEPEPDPEPEPEPGDHT